MKVFITGGTGFIGTHLCLQYARKGHQVVTVSRQATPAENENAEFLQQNGIETVRGDIMDKDLLGKCCRGAAVVHHIAAAMREANIADSHFWKVNVQATQELLEAARSEGVQRLVYCSSIGAMGKFPKKPANEHSECKPMDIYQVTKRAAEKLCLEFFQATGLPLSIVRPADVYGPRDRRLLKLFRAIKKRTFALIGDGRNEHHMVYIDDLVAGMMGAAEVKEAVGEVFILAGEQPIRVKELVLAIAKDLAVPPPRLRLPLFPVRLAAVCLETLCRPLGLQPPLYPRRVDFFRSDYAFDISKAKRVLGYRPAFDVPAGVRQTRLWYEQNKLL
jgi:nucleoside-diphosphate-sugar epimerase